MFAAKWIPALRQAVADLSLLRTRGYSEKSALKLVGDRYQLNVRQRRAVLGASCDDDSLNYRSARLVPADALAGQTLGIDGYNLLITVESTLSNGVLLKGRDGAIRDLASIHRSYRRVEETYPAIHLIGNTLRELAVGRANWYFDAPISNSGKLKAMFYEEAEKSGWNWHIELVPNPDNTLAESDSVVITSDGWILDRAGRWTNLAEEILAKLNPRPRVIHLAETPLERGFNTSGAWQ